MEQSRAKTVNKTLKLKKVETKTKENLNMCILPDAKSTYSKRTGF